jgi:serine/threonine-protein kinase
MSPEQARGEKTLDGRSDLWALGVILFQLITGKLPFEGATAFDIVAEILKGDIPRLSTAAPDLDPRFDTIIGCCLTRDRDLRPNSAAELISMLEPIASPREAIHDLVTQSLVNAQRVSGSVISAMPSSNEKNEKNDDELPPTQGADELEGQIGTRRTQSSAPPRSQVSTLSVAAATLALSGPRGAAKAPAPSAAGVALGSEVLASMTAATRAEESGPPSEAESMTPSQIAAVTPSHRWMIVLLVGVVLIAAALGLWDVTGPH